MDAVGDLFNAASMMGTDENLDYGGLTSTHNIGTYVLRTAIEVMTLNGVPRSFLGPEETTSHLDDLLQQHQKSINEHLRSAGIGSLCGKTVESWNVMPDMGGFATIGGFPCASMRIMVLPCKVEVSCHPEQFDFLQSYLQLAAFEARVFHIVAKFVNDLGLASVTIESGERVMDLRDFITEFHTDVLDQVRQVLTNLPE